MQQQPLKGGLVLTRAAGQQVLVGDPHDPLVAITVTRGHARLHVAAPREIPIHRAENVGRVRTFHADETPMTRLLDLVEEREALRQRLRAVEREIGDIRRKTNQPAGAKGAA